jgi:predicted HicB family RNase H-like nuclease
MLRLPKELHRDVFVGARRAGKSLNQFVVDRLRQAS